MKTNLTYFSLVLFALFLCLAPRSTTATLAQQVVTPTDEKYIYADFEHVENGRAVSNNGGLIQIFTGQESTPVKYKGLGNASPGAPELVKTNGDEKNHLAAFEYSLMGPNQWANVTLEIQGHPNQDQKPVADDLSAYKTMTLQLYATGSDSIRVEMISHGHAIKLDAGFPQIPLKIKPGLNTYVIPIKNLQQPSWQQQRVSTKEVLKQLTAISISAYCGPCTPQSGQVIVDNVIFQK